jgi:hypothetical protein
MRFARVGLSIAFVGLSGLCVSCASKYATMDPRPEGDGAVAVTDDAGAPVNDAANDATSDPTSDSSTSADAAQVAANSPCAAGDPDRLFWNDFEGGRYYAAPGMTYDPSRDYIDVKPEQFAIVDGNVQPMHGGNHALRGNLWPDHPDPVAQAQGITIQGARATQFGIDLGKLGISQSPSPTPGAANPPPGELYVSFWLWFDADFSHEATDLTTGKTITQQIKLFYAFGQSGVEWVATDYATFAVNENNMGVFFPVVQWNHVPHPLEGRWSHIEWYFKEESKPVFYEVGPFSSGGYLASACSPQPTNWMPAWPIPGSNPMTCLTPAQAFAQDSKDGIFVMKVDGQVVHSYDNMAWDGRFGRIEFPAYHGGGGYPLASAGWAIDDVCLRRTKPAGF